jgi:hypothetical protein
MQGVKGLFVLLLGALTAGAVHAADLKSDCDGHLTGATNTAANEFEFAVSDLEGLYLELVEDAGKLALLTEPNTRAIETYLKKKAQFLNDIVPIIGNMQASPSINLNVLYMMVTSVGAPGEAYGFAVDQQGQLRFVPPVRMRDQSRGHFQEPIRIGFEDHIHEPTKAFLTPNLSIGFGPQVVVPEAVPLRQGGQLIITRMPNNTSLFVVIDMEKGLKKAYVAPVQILTAMSVHTAEKAMNLEFAPGKGWFISYTSLLNPEGKIGF